jgi:hypothetical protein
MAGSAARRTSERLKDKAQKEAAELEEKKRREEQERLEKLEKEGLPLDGSLEFRYSNGKSKSPAAFKINRKELYRTKDGTMIHTWAIQAFWKSSDFYPGQIVKFTHTFPQTDPKAKYSEQIGMHAATTYGPVGMNHLLGWFPEILKC